MALPETPSSSSQINNYSPQETTSIRSVLIIGAGLAGLAAAIGLRQSDYDVTVLERTAELQEVRFYPPVCTKDDC